MCLCVCMRGTYAGPLQHKCQGGAAKTSRCRPTAAQVPAVGQNESEDLTDAGGAPQALYSLAETVAPCSGPIIQACAIGSLGY